MSPSAALPLCMLRLQLNRSYLTFQIAVDLLIPVGYALLAAHAGADADRSRLVTAAILIGGMLSIMRLPAYILMNERFGPRDLLVAAGVTRRDYLLANAVGSLYFALFPAIAMLATAALLHQAVPTAPAYWAVIFIYMLTLHGAALILGGAFRGFGPFVLTVNLALLGATAFSPIYYPAANVPAAIRPVVDFLPGSLAADLAARAAASSALEPVALAALAGWCVIALVFGYRTAPWRPVG